MSQTSDEFYATKKLHTYEIKYLDGTSELIQAHSLSYHDNMTAFAGMFGGQDKPTRINFFRHPEGVVLTILEQDTKSVRLLEIEEVKN